MKIKTFINNFNFAEPNWSSLPEGFPNLNTDGLNKEERHLLYAIKTAWIVENLRTTILTTVLNGTLSVFSVIVIFFGTICITYYLNIELKLGFNFLTELFA